MQIVRYPHPALRFKSVPITQITEELRAAVREMFDLMYAAEGIGLAANQVALPYRVFVLNLTGKREEKDQEHVFINPVISNRRGIEEKDEGCLSLPQIFAPVKRSQKIMLSAYNLKGEEVNLELDGIYARVVQHECDHLDGKLFVDRLTPANLLKIKQDLEDMEIAFSGERERGVIPEDRLIVARLAELETART